MSEQTLPKPEQPSPILEVQLAKPEDAAGVFDVQRQTWIDTYPNAEAGITEQDIRNRVEGEHGELVPDKIAWWRKGIETSGENRAIFVVKDDDKVVGFVAPGIMDGQRRIGAIYVLPEAQGKGLGRKLLNKAIDWHGRDKDIYLHVASYNDNAIGFYEKNGFEKTGRAVEDLDARERGVVEIPEIEMVLKADSDTNKDWQAIEQQLPNLKNVEGGFSQAQRGLVTLPDGKEVFVKVGTAENTKMWARKEVAVYRFLEEHDFEHSPRLITTNPDGSAFAIEALTSQDGWDWQDNWTTERLTATLKAMDNLAAIKPSDTERAIFTKSSISQEENGWQPLQESPEMQEILLHKLHGAGADDIAQSVSFAADNDKAKQYDFADDTLVHYDLRADNCAWNPNTGQVRLIDWNWAQFGDRDIDLAATLTHIQKSGFDVPSELVEKIDPDAFHWMAGFWFNQAVTPIWEGGPEGLRDLQLLSGITALRLAKAKS